MKSLLFFLFPVFCFSCFENDSYIITENIQNDLTLVNNNQDLIIPKQENYISFFNNNPNHFATKFQFPVGPPNAEGYYNAQKFGANLHLGDDWNGVGGGNTDLGDTIYSVGNGYLNVAKDFKGGWGNIVRVIHKLPENDEFEYVETFYAHLNEMFVKKGQKIEIGDPLGTIGNCNGAYLAHLHFEIRDQPELSIGFGYSEDTKGYLDPTQFIKKRR